jgi:hypothetical protein
MGNQLFQYACGRAFALASGGQLVLDVSQLHAINERVTRRDFELDVFGIKARLATAEEMSKTRYATRWGRVGAWMTGLEVRAEAPNLYPNVVHQVRRDTVLEGYWQSEACFAAYAKDIHADLIEQRELSEQSQRIAHIVASAPSVAIHVRRGDYVSLLSAARFHGALPLAYYQQAAQHIQSLDRNVLWVVFSDDIEWCRSALSFLGSTALFVDHNHGCDAWQDLHLMSLCQHHIIANSSFSWWGAWLSERRNRRNQFICAPAKWFVRRDPYADFRIPKRWTRL